MNPRCYEIDASYAVANATKTALTLISATTVRPEIYDLEMGFSSAPADAAFQVFAQRFTAAGTAGSSNTPSPLDPSDPACQATSGQGLSAEPTYTSGKILAHFALNQRATHRWIADQRGPLKMPATANNGIGLYAVNASATPNFDVCCWFCE
jgi:hypothetical protein